MIYITALSVDSSWLLDAGARRPAREDLTNADLRNLRGARRSSFLAARVALRALLAKVTNEEEWGIRLSEEGKPFLAAKTGGIRVPSISISHSGKMVAAALSYAGEVGIDIEEWRERDFSALARFAFGKGEADAVALEGKECFYRIWTLREALAKAEGRGLRRVLDGGDQFAAAPACSFWSQDNWGFASWQRIANHSLSLAARSRCAWNADAVGWVDIEVGP